MSAYDDTPRWHNRERELNRAELRGCLFGMLITVIGCIGMLLIFGVRP